MVILAQQVSMEQFPPGPALEVWLYERPVPTMIVLVVLGLVGAYVLRQKELYKWSPAPVIAALVLATGVWSLASVVDTGREKIEAGTRDFIESMLTGDRPGARGLLSRDVILAGAGSVYEIDADGLAGAAEQAASYVDSYRLRKLSATLDGPNVGRTRFEITIGSGGTPLPMGWELGWQKRSGSWRIVRADCKHIFNSAPQNNFGRWLPRLR